MTNYDEKTGIRYGVISPHSINQDALNDIYTNGTDPYYGEGIKEIKQHVQDFISSYPYRISEGTQDSIRDMLIEDFSDGYENPDGAIDYSDNEYDLHVSGDNFGIFVMKSPYYTYCRGCSPCAPGAGDLDSPMTSYIGAISTNFDKALCLGTEWFDQDNPIPYRVFRVDNDQEVLPETCAE